MFIDSWDSFLQQARELFIAEPIRTRYCIKYRHCDGNFVVKVTDDRTCLQFKSDQQVDLKKLEALNNIMFAGMSKGPEAADESVPDQAEQQQPQQAVQRQSNRKTTRRRG